MTDLFFHDEVISGRILNLRSTLFEIIILFSSQERKNYFFGLEFGLKNRRKFKKKIRKKFWKKVL